MKKKENISAILLLLSIPVMALGKMLGWLDCSWWVVTSPIWIPFLIVAIIFILIMTIGCIGLFAHKKK